MTEQLMTVERQKTDRDSKNKYKSSGCPAEGESQDAPHHNVYQIGMAEAHAQTKSILH